MARKTIHEDASWRYLIEDGRWVDDRLPDSTPTDFTYNALLLIVLAIVMIALAIAMTRYMNGLAGWQ